MKLLASNSFRNGNYKVISRLFWTSFQTFHSQCKSTIKYVIYFTVEVKELPENLNESRRVSGLRAEVSYFLCFTQKRDVCITVSLIVFQHPAVFQEFMESALIGCLTVGIVRFNSDWLSLKNTQYNLCGHNFSGALNCEINTVIECCIFCVSWSIAIKILLKVVENLQFTGKSLSLQFAVHSRRQATRIL